VVTGCGRGPNGDQGLSAILARGVRLNPNTIGPTDYRWNAICFLGGSEIGRALPICGSIAYFRAM
jgi:hypothetical protein